MTLKLVQAEIFYALDRYGAVAEITLAGNVTIVIQPRQISGHSWTNLEISADGTLYLIN